MDTPTLLLSLPAPVPMSEAAFAVLSRIAPNARQDTLKAWGTRVHEGDGGDELIIGVRDNPAKGDAFTEQRGVRIYKAQDDRGRKWTRQIIDNGGVAVEDLAADDLDGDGKVDIVAVGRALLQDPNWAQRVLSGRLSELAPYDPASLTRLT